MRVFVNDSKEAIELIGKVSSWAENGLDDRAIHVYYRREGWLSRLAFIDVDNVRETVRNEIHPEDYRILGNLLENLLHQLSVAEEKYFDMLDHIERNERTIEFAHDEGYFGQIKKISGDVHVIREEFDEDEAFRVEDLLH